MKAFFSKLKTWIASHVWQSIVIGVTAVSVVSAAIVLPIVLSDEETDLIIEDKGVLFVESYDKYLIQYLANNGKAVSLENIDRGDYDAYAQSINTFIQSHPNNDLYVGYGFKVSFGKRTDASILDQKCNTDKPIIIIGETYNSCWLNTAAIKRYIGNIEGTEDEKLDIMKWINDYNDDCTFIDRRSKMPVGYFRSSAYEQIIKDALYNDTKNIENAILELQRFAKSNGYSSIDGLSISKSDLEIFKSLDLDISFTLYHKLELNVPSCRSIDNILSIIETVKTEKEETANSKYKVVGIAFPIDGDFLTNTAFTVDEVLATCGEDTSYCGINKWYFFLNNSDKVSIISEANELGLVVLVHAVGDKAIKETLDAFETSAELAGLEETPTYGNIIFGCGLIDTTTIDADGFCKDLTDLERFAKLGIKAIVDSSWSSQSQDAINEVKKAIGDKVNNLYNYDVPSTLSE